MKTFLSRAIVVMLTVTLALIVWVIGGCGDETELVVPGPDKTAYPFPDSPEQLMANFIAAYTARDLEGYRLVLHEDFRFVLAATAVADGLPESWDRAEELRIAANMFSGEDLVRPGRVVPAITRIVFEQCEARGAWTFYERPDGAGAMRRAYLIRADFLRRDGSVLSVEGECIFHVVRAPMPAPEGGTRSGYRMILWEDHTD